MLEKTNLEKGMTPGTESPESGEPRDEGGARPFAQGQKFSTVVDGIEARRCGVWTMA